MINVETADFIVKKHVGNQSIVQSIEFWGGGLYNQCYKITATNPASHYFLKVENDIIYPTIRRGQIEKEVYGLGLLSKAGIPCPQIIGYEFKRDITGIRYLLTEFLEDELLLLSWDSLSSEEKQVLKTEMLDIIEKMNGITVTCFGDIYEDGYIGNYETWQSCNRALGESLLNDGIMLDVFTCEEADIIRKAIEKELSQCTLVYTPGFSHGDLGPHNIIYSPAKTKNKLTVIDCGNSSFKLKYADEKVIRERSMFGIENKDIFIEYSLDKDAYEADIIDRLENIIFEAFIRTGTDLSHCPEPILAYIDYVRKNDSRGKNAGFIRDCVSSLEAI